MGCIIQNRLASQRCNSVTDQPTVPYLSAVVQHAMNHRQQQQQQARQGRSSGMIPDPKSGSGLGDRPTPSISEMDRQITSSGSGPKRNSPANSTAAGSSMQVHFLLQSNNCSMQTVSTLTVSTQLLCPQCAMQTGSVTWGRRC